MIPKSPSSSEEGVGGGALVQIEPAGSQPPLDPRCQSRRRPGLKRRGGISGRVGEAKLLRA